MCSTSLNHFLLKSVGFRVLLGAIKTIWVANFTLNYISPTVEVVFCKTFKDNGHPTTLVSTIVSGAQPHCMFILQKFRFLNELIIKRRTIMIMRMMMSGKLEISQVLKQWQAKSKSGISTKIKAKVYTTYIHLYNWVTSLFTIQVYNIVGADG